LNDRLHIGTSGWSYKHWADIFYPPDVKPAKYLEHYIRYFDCVELNASFYHLPLKSTVEGWMMRTPPSFNFCPKVSRFITHQLRLSNTSEALDRFFDVFQMMYERLGPLLVQLPPGLKFDQAKVAEFLALLKSNYTPFLFAFEVRHETWINDQFFELLRQYGYAFVIADSGKRYPYHEIATAEYIYLRFHGNESLYASDYSDDDLRYYGGRISEWLKNNHEVWVFFNNDVHGYALKNAFTLKKVINQLVS
jgi:uncharacterized protein YecE (DUF72 family)